MYKDIPFIDLHRHLDGNIRAKTILELGQKDFSVKINLIGILSRTFGVNSCFEELSALLAHKNDLVAVDLAGDELGKLGHLFINISLWFKKLGYRLLFTLVRLMIHLVFIRRLMNYMPHVLAMVLMRYMMKS